MRLPTETPSAARGWRRIARRFGWLPAVSIVAIAMTAPLPTTAHADAGPTDGLAPMCKDSGYNATNGATHDAHYVLTAKDGYILTPDLNSIYTWSYSDGSDAFQEPGPALCVTEGDTVTITLQNQLPVPTSINVLGITGMTFSGMDATPTGLTPFSGPATPSADDLKAGNLVPSVAPNATGTYTFVAAHAGTYLYESGTSPQEQDQMGLIGALIVRPAGHPAYLYDPAETGWDPVANKPVNGHGFSTEFNPDREFLHVLSEFDPDLHACFEEARFNRTLPQQGDATFASRCNPKTAPFTYDMTQYKARYWFINGRSFPDTIDPNNAAHLPGQPFSALVHVRPRADISQKTGQVVADVAPAVVRYLNAGPTAYPFHPHAQHEMVVGVDGRPKVSTATNTLLSAANANDKSLTLANNTPMPMTGETVSFADGTSANVAGVSGTTIDLTAGLTQSEAKGATVSWMENLTDDHFGLTIVPGQTEDTFFSWVDAVGWDPQTRPIAFGGAAQNWGSNGDFSGVYADAPGVIVPQDAEKVNGELWSGSPYLGFRATKKPGELQFNECGEYYDIAHSHALFQVTNFGAGVGGMLTFIRVDPIDGCPAS